MKLFKLYELFNLVFLDTIWNILSDELLLLHFFPLLSLFIQRCYESAATRAPHEQLNITQFYSNRTKVKNHLTQPKKKLLKMTLSATFLLFRNYPLFQVFFNFFLFDIFLACRFFKLGAIFIRIFWKPLKKIRKRVLKNGFAWRYLNLQPLYLRKEDFEIE